MCKLLEIYFDLQPFVYSLTRTLGHFFLYKQSCLYLVKFSIIWTYEISTLLCHQHGVPCHPSWCRNYSNSAIWKQLLSLSDILLCCGFSRSTFFRILKTWQETGDVIVEWVVYGWYWSLHQTDIHYLLQLIHQKTTGLQDYKTTKNNKLEISSMHNIRRSIFWEPQAYCTKSHPPS